MKDGKSEIAVVVPLVSGKYILDFLKSVEANTVIPDQVIVIDNSCDGLDIMNATIDKIGATELNLEWRVFPQNLGVNKSWMLAKDMVIPECKYISFCNDDLLLSKTFFQRTSMSLDVSEQCGCYCPSTAIHIDDFNKACEVHHNKSLLVKMNRREGWCFTFKKDVLNSLPSIPYDKFNIFCGDDWLFRFSMMAGRYWVKDLNNAIFHHVGVSRGKDPKYVALMRSERMKFRIAYQAKVEEVPVKIDTIKG